MNRTRVKLNVFLYFISALILIAGLAGAGAVYHRAIHETDGDSSYEVVGGFVYHAENNKRYVHDLQLYGGKSAVLADDFMRWLRGLWHGTSLAFTIACITIFLSCVVFIAAKNVGPWLPHAKESESNETELFSEDT